MQQRHDRARASSTSRKLYAETGASPTIPASPRPPRCEIAITYIDGDEGVLLYRGYPIEQLAEHGDFLEVCYLLLYGELPTAAQKADFDYRVTQPHDGARADAALLPAASAATRTRWRSCAASVGALSAFYHDSTDITDP